MRILLSAYACEPGKGSEPGVGWNLALQLAGAHEVTVLTRRNNRMAIETRLREKPVDGLRFVYHDLPRWLSWWKRGGRGVQLYYYLWQITARGIVRTMTRRGDVDICHHVTFAKYWGPSALSASAVCYSMGPLGGADEVPPGLESVLGLGGRVYELARRAVRFVAEHDPTVRNAIRQSSACIGATAATSERLRALGAKRVETWNQVGVESVSDDGQRRGDRADFRLVCVGRLVPLKAVALAIEAVARCETSVTMEVVGDGPSRDDLERLASSRGLSERVRFVGEVPRESALERMRDCDALIHPSLHDSGGMVCAEAMSMGKPVIALDWAGPADLVTQECGVLVDPIGGAEAVTAALCDAITLLADDTALTARLGDAARRRVREHLTWGRKAALLEQLFDEMQAVAK